jgi:hypothetical protein
MGPLPLTVRNAIGSADSFTDLPVLTFADLALPTNRCLGDAQGRAARIESGVAPSMVFKRCAFVQPARRDRSIARAAARAASRKASRVAPTLAVPLPAMS